MKRSPLKRRTPLRAKKQMRASSKPRRDRHTVFVFGQPGAPDAWVAMGTADDRLTAERWKREYEAMGHESKVEPYKRRRNSYANRERAWFFMGWVKTQPCCVTVIGTAGVIDLQLSLATVDMFRCRHRFNAKCGVVEADHAGERIGGLGTKSKDRDTIPLCYGHHWDRTNSRGIFEHMTPEQRVEWRGRAIEHTHNQARLMGVEIPDC